jgi:hypothetical protein
MYLRYVVFMLSSTIRNTSGLNRLRCQLMIVDWGEEPGSNDERILLLLLQL